MSLDRIINWKQENPTKDQIQMVLEDYFSDETNIKWDKDRWFIDLPGKTSPALKRIPDSVVFGKCDEKVYPRWIEVWSGNNTLYIITRSQDEFTNALAQGLAELFKRFWKAELL